MNTGPIEAWQLINVLFLEPDQDLRIKHKLDARPDRIGYIPIGKSRDCTLYDARLTPEAPPWNSTSIVLRSNVAPVLVQLLVVALAPDRLPE